MCYAHPPRIRLARCLSIVGDTDINVHLCGVTEVFISVFDEFETGSELPISRTMVGHGTPRIGCNWTRLPRASLFGLGWGLGMNALSGCFFSPGKFVSSIINLIFKKECFFYPEYSSLQMWGSSDSSKGKRTGI